MTEININSKQKLIIEARTGRSKYGSFPEVRLRVGKKKMETILHCHIKHIPAIMEGLKAAMDTVFKTDDFYQTAEWLKLRYEVLKKYQKCELCGAKDNLHVDHVRPRSKYPELELEPENMQILCGSCNLGKSNRDCEDYRREE